MTADGDTIGQRRMGGGAKDTIDAQRRRQRRDGVAMRNGHDGRRCATSNGRGDTTIKKMHGKKWTIKKRRAGVPCSLETIMAAVMASALR